MHTDTHTKSFRPKGIVTKNISAAFPSQLTLFVALHEWKQHEIAYISCSFYSLLIKCVISVMSFSNKGMVRLVRSKPHLKFCSFTEPI
jgi:hypothetical protein